MWNRISQSGVYFFEQVDRLEIYITSISARKCENKWNRWYWFM